MGSQALALTTDVSKAEQVEAMVKQTLDEWRKVLSERVLPLLS
jgi:NADP-dependent 3-hydroxy acid dehydrogenase YdfG